MVWLILAALLSGVVAGMGMGGGTVYIPVLTHVFGVPQHLAQWVNLVAFVPMAVATLAVHAHHRLLDGRAFLRLVIPSFASALGFSFLALRLRPRLLSLLFSLLLVAAGVAGVVVTAHAFVEKRRADKLHEPRDLF